MTEAVKNSKAIPTILGGSVVGVIIYVLLQFGIIGPAAEAKIVEQERRLTKVEYQLEAQQAQLATSKDNLREMLEPMKVQINWMANDLKDIKDELKKERAQ